MFINNLYFQCENFSKIKPYQDALLKEYNDNKIGYYHLPSLSHDLIKQIEKFKENMSYKKICVIGVGGSSLGTKAISSMIISTKLKNTPKLDFFENLDPITISYKLSKINIDETLFLIVSKSGLTIETISITKIILKYFNIQISSKHFAVITDKNSPLEDFATKYNLQVFHIDKNIGGRFSVLSAVGLVPLLLCGYDVSKIVDGAKECETNIFKKMEPSIFQKAYKYFTSKHICTNILFSYSDMFREINDWYIQLWAESLGKIDKNGKRVGLTPVGLIGSVDQHSFLQLIIDGPKNKSVTFLRFEDFDSHLNIPNTSLSFLEKCDLSHEMSVGSFLNEQCLATMQSVINEGILVDEIILKKLDEHSVGYLIYYFEVLTSIVGIMFGINTYNQPGVEIGKKILLEKLGNNYKRKES